MLSFSTFQKGRRWFGLKKLGLKGKQTAVSDCILLANKGRFVGSDDGDVWPKQQLAVDLARAAMVPVHRTAFATLHVNEMFFGEPRSHFRVLLISVVIRRVHHARSGGRGAHSVDARRQRRQLGVLAVQRFSSFILMLNVYSLTFLPVQVQCGKSAVARR